MKGIKGNRITGYELVKQNPYKITDEEFRKTMATIELHRIIENQGYKKKTTDNYINSIDEMLYFLDLINATISEVKKSDVELYNKILIRRGYTKPQARRKINRIKKCIFVYKDIFESMPSGAMSIVTEIRKGNMFDLLMLGNSIDFMFSNIITGMNVMSKFENGIHEISSETWGHTHTITYKNISSHEVNCLGLNYMSKACTTLSNMIVTYEELMRTDWKLVVEEHELKLKKLRLQKKQIKNLKLVLQEVQEHEEVKKEKIEETIRELKVVVMDNWKKEKELRDIAHKWLEEKKKVA